MPPINRPTGILAATGERIALKQIRAAHRMARPFLFSPACELTGLQRHSRQSAKSESTRRCRGQVDDAAPHERSTIIDPHGHAAAVAFICHAHASAKRQRAMRRCETIRLSAFATGGTLTRIGIHRGDARFCHGRKRTPKENHCAADRGSETHKHSTISPIVPSGAWSDRTRTCVLTAKIGPFLDIEVPKPNYSDGRSFHGSAVV